ncbi:MAG: hypothetical protein M3O30_12535 [Planctomycetota bacterium]|nr:hypothetical protein [Planctomycetota bacterium]
MDEKVHIYAMVLTQDCDLESDFRGRPQDSEGHQCIPNVLLCEAIETETLKGRVPSGKDIWKRIIQNKDERYHCLECVPAEHDLEGSGMCSIGIDFKRYFTVPTDEIYRRIEIGQARRRCVLITPYAEQLLDRFFHFQARIPIPENHDVMLSSSAPTPDRTV